MFKRLLFVAVLSFVIIISANTVEDWQGLLLSVLNAEREKRKRLGYTISPSPREAEQGHL